MIARRFRRIAVPLAVGVIGLGLTGCSSKTTSDAATITYSDVTGTHTVHITRTEFKKELGALVGSAPFQEFLKGQTFDQTGDQKNTTSADISSTYLGQVVEQTAIDIEFVRLGLTVSSVDRDNAVKQMQASFAITGKPAGVVYASFPKSLQTVLVDRAARTNAIADYFANASTPKQEALFNEFASTICPSGRQVSQILVKDAATAQTILDQLRGGASFADLAKTKSTDPASAKVGGSVGCLRKGAFVKEFETAAYAAPFGVPIGPVKSQFGYHVILVNHPTFADVGPEIAQALQQNPIVLTQELRLQAMKVWVNPQFGKGGLAVDSQNQLRYQVVPPSVPAPRTCREAQFPCSTTTTSTVAPAASPGG